MAEINLALHEQLTIHVGGMHLRVVESETHVAVWLRREHEGSYLIYQSFEKVPQKPLTNSG